MYLKSPGTWLRQEHILSAPGKSHPTVALQGVKQDLPSPWKQSPQVDRMEGEDQTNWKLIEEPIQKVPTLYASRTLYPRPKTLIRPSIDAAPNWVVVPLRNILQFFKVPADNKFKLAHWCSWSDSPGVWHLWGTSSSMSSTSPTAHNSGWHFQHRRPRKYQNEILSHLLQNWQQLGIKPTEM